MSSSFNLKTRFNQKNITIEQVKRLREEEDHVEFMEAITQYNYNGGRKSALGYAVALANERGGNLILAQNRLYVVHSHSVIKELTFRFQGMDVWF